MLIYKPVFPTVWTEGGGNDFRAAGVTVFGMDLELGAGKPEASGLRPPIALFLFLIDAGVAKD